MSLRMISVDDRLPDMNTKVLIVRDAHTEGDAIKVDCHMAFWDGAAWRQDGTGNVLTKVNSWIVVERLLIDILTDEFMRSSFAG